MNIEGQNRLDDINPQTPPLQEGHFEVNNDNIVKPDNLEKEIDISTQSKDILSKFERLSQKENIHGFELFSHLINNTSINNQERFLEKGNLATLKGNIMETKSFPINEFELLSLFVGEKTTQIVEDNKQQSYIEDLDTLTHIDNIKKLNISLSGINLEDTQLKALLLEASGLPNKFTTKQEVQIAKELSQKITARLSQTQEIEKVILPQAKANGTLDEVSQSLVALSPDFQKRIDAWNLGEQYPKVTDLPLEQQSRIDVALDNNTSKAEKSGNIFTLDGEDGFQVDYDVVTQERRLSVDGYSLESNVPDAGDYQTPKLEYTKIEQENLPAIKTIELISQTLKDKGVGVDEFAEIQATIRTIPGASELGISFASLTSGEAIQEALKNKLTDSRKKISEARKDYESILTTLRDTQILSLKEKDKKVKETLDFLESIGFTDIPQSVTNQVIDMININPKAYGFDTQISLVDGQIGMDKNVGSSGKIDIADKQAFAEAINKMMGVQDSDGKSPINIENLVAGKAAVGDKARFTALLAESGLLNVGGAATAVANLQKVEQ